MIEPCVDLVIQQILECVALFDLLKNKHPIFLFLGSGVVVKWIYRGKSKIQWRKVSPVRNSM